MASEPITLAKETLEHRLARAYVSGFLDGAAHGWQGYEETRQAAEATAIDDVRVTLFVMGKLDEYRATELAGLRSDAIRAIADEQEATMRALEDAAKADWSPTDTGAEPC